MSLPHKSDGLVLVEDTVVCPLLIQKLRKTVNNILFHYLSSFFMPLTFLLPDLFKIQQLGDVHFTVSLTVNCDFMSTPYVFTSVLLNINCEV